MEKTQLNAVLIAGALLLATAAAIHLGGESKFDSGGWDAFKLPSEAGGLSGVDLLYCQNETCMHAFEAPADAPQVCPRCGGELDTVALAEKRLLPGDTRIVRRKYGERGRPGYVVSVVISGLERRSIHKPQVCLVGQGYAIVDNAIETVPVEGRNPLQIMVLDVIPQTTRQAGNAVIPRSYFAYWFQERNRETPHHWRRMLWIAWDGVFRNTRRRWAYVSIATGTIVDPRGRDDLLAFASDLRAAMHESRREAPLTHERQYKTGTTTPAP